MDKSKFGDEKLVNRYIKGDEKCLEILLSRYQERIFRTIMKEAHYNRAFAEDIFQEALFRAVRALKEGNYIHQNYFAAWIEKIAKHLIIDHHRSKYGKMRTVSTLRNRDGEETDIFDVVKVKDEKMVDEEMVKDEVRKHNRAQVKELVKKLPKKFRDVVFMRLYFKMSFLEIADTLDINLNTALGRMRYALRDLRIIMQKEGLEVSKEKILGIMQ